MLWSMEVAYDGEDEDVGEGWEMGVVRLGEVGEEGMLGGVWEGDTRFREGREETRSRGGGEGAEKKS